MKLSTIFFSLLAIFAMACFSSCDDDNVNIEEGTDDVLNSEFEIEFVKTFGGSNIDDAIAVVEANDGGYVLLGTTESTDGDITGKTDDDQDFWLVKLSRQGDMIWERTYGGSENDRARGLNKTIDGGYILSGQSRSEDGDVSGNEGFNDFWVVKVDSNGMMEWESNFGFVGNDQAFDAFQTSDGGYFAIGILDVTASAGAGNTGRPFGAQHAGGDYWAIKMNASGELVWSRYFGGSFTDTAHSAVETENGEFIIAGFSDSDDVDISENKGTYDFWIVRVAANGDIVWEKNYGGSEIDIPYGVTIADDGNIVFAGDTRSENGDVGALNGNADIWMTKIDQQGNLVWQNTFGGMEFESARSVNQLNSGNFVIAGNTRSSDGDISENKGFNDCFAMIVDNDGNLVFEGTYGGSNLDFGNDAIQTSDGKLLVIGNTESNDLDIDLNKGIKDILIIKLTE